MEARIEALLVQFKDFLQEGSEQTLESSSPEQEQTLKQHVDLFHLYTELEALKVEVKREVRQQKEVFTRFSELVDNLQDNNKRLTQALEQQKEAQKNTAYQAEQTVLLDLIDLHDRLRNTRQAIEHYTPSWLELRSPKTQAFYTNLQEGLDITLRRLTQTLENYEISRINSKGQRMDPHTMRVMEVRVSKHYDEGTVLEEVRPGYLRDDKVLRLAEVIASRQPE